MKRTLLTIIILFNTGTWLGAQPGSGTYEFLNAGYTSYTNMLGGINVSLDATNDPALAYYNPALLSASSGGNISLNYTNYLAGINYGFVSGSYATDSIGNFSAGIAYFNYGSFIGADATGAATTEFSAAEYALVLGWSYNIDSLFRLGLNVKPVFSHLERYTSFGLAFDLGAFYKSRNGLFSTGASLRNAGMQLKTYSGIREKLPFDIAAGASLKLQHAPVRFSLNAYNIQTYDLLGSIYNEDITREYEGIARIGENIMRHLVFSLEILPSDRFYIAGGLNYRRRKELLNDYRLSTVGFSLGGGLTLKSFSLGIARSHYHLAGSLTTFSFLLKPYLFSSLK